MAKLTAENTPALEDLQAAAERKTAADANLERLIRKALRAGVPAVRVAEVAGIGRATLYRRIGQGVES